MQAYFKLNKVYRYRYVNGFTLDKVAIMHPLSSEQIAMVQDGVNRYNQVFIDYQIKRWAIFVCMLGIVIALATMIFGPVFFKNISSGAIVCAGVGILCVVALVCMCYTVSMEYLQTKKMRECTDLLNLQYQINGFTFTYIKKMKYRHVHYRIEVGYPIPTDDGSSNPIQPVQNVLPQQPLCNQPNNYPNSTPKTPLLYYSQYSI
ncbi:hypothetical protein DLAC_07422 [Tieghemostelium lacteum]|uniref:Uncharacterized protein n=1 Tax=Tieghemostelium lacteum TaxID=361077 RepID=A0A151ZCJ3_TIELA|nr:hypothetical protein DLAC_07422 [Tieghemostelium lacteum]|eukprot:KYQ91645.1 hypothetical protein DLAC_07422 [Tieghemostelium lacteum]